MDDVVVCSVCGNEITPCAMHPIAMVIAKSDWAKRNHHLPPTNFIDPGLLAGPRLRRMAEIMSHLPQSEREELADLIFEEVDENLKQLLRRKSGRFSWGH